ncbi:hypothetical protein C7S13_4761 [Burkholderia cepacia]|nr:hypothetical protein [Burkholderia cepacia]
MRDIAPPEQTIRIRYFSRQFFRVMKLITSGNGLPIEAAIGKILRLCQVYGPD